MNLDSIRFVPARNYTVGRKAAPTLIVIHDMEAGESSTTAENCASYFAGPNAPRASAHYSCDNDSTVCSVKPQDTAWHTGENRTNDCGIGIEQAGYANQDYAVGSGWGDEYSQAMIRTQVAPLCAALCEKYGIPVRFLDAAALQSGEFSGITSHGQISKAFVPGGHTDPGPNYPFDLLLQLIAEQSSPPVKKGKKMFQFTSTTDGRMVLFGIGYGQVTHRWQGAPNGGFGPWAVLNDGQPFAVDNLTVERNADGRFDIMAWNSATGQTCFRTQNKPNGAWRAWRLEL